jgi:hypothetical protein
VQLAKVSSGEPKELRVGLPPDPSMRHGANHTEAV